MLGGTFIAHCQWRRFFFIFFFCVSLCVIMSRASEC